MKKSNIKPLEQNIKETVLTMETVLFTNINERIVDSYPINSYYNLLDFIAFENKLNAHFTPHFICGSLNDIEKAQDKLIESVKYN